MALVGENPKVSCINKLETSERVAYYNSPNMLGVVTVAFEDKTAIFHIGSHSGKTAEDLIVPSLRKIIASPNVAQVRRQYPHGKLREAAGTFRPKSARAVELRHIHNWIIVGHSEGGQPRSCITKLCSLDKQSGRASQDKSWVALEYGQQHGADECLGSEVHGRRAKGIRRVRCLRKLYALSRLAMDAVTPPPMWAERYVWYRHISRRHHAAVGHERP